MAKLTKRQKALAGKGFCDDIRRDSGMARIQDEAQTRVVDLANDLRQILHPAARVNAFGHVLDTDFQAHRPRGGSQSRQAVTQVVVPVGEYFSVRKPAGMHDQHFRIQGGCPVRGSQKIVQRFLSQSWIRVGQINFFRANRLSAPGAVNAPDIQAGSFDFVPEFIGRRQGIPARKNFDAGCSKFPNEFQIGIDDGSGWAMDDHAAEHTFLRGR